MVEQQSYSVINMFTYSFSSPGIFFQFDIIVYLMYFVVHHITLEVLPHFVGGVCSRHFIKQTFIATNAKDTLNALNVSVIIT